MPRLKNTLKMVILALGLLVVARPSHATDVAYTGVFQGTEGPAKVTGNTAAHTYTRDMNTTGDRISVQIVTSSFTGLSNQTFTDGTLSTGSVTVSSSPAQGIANTTVCVNGICVTSGSDWTWDPAGDSTGTCTSIGSALLAKAAISSIVTSTCTTGGSIIYSTSTSVGTTANYTLTTSTPAALAASGSSHMTGGTNSAYTIQTPTITIASNGFTTGVQVLYSKASGANIGGLTDQTTYYVAMVNPNGTTGLSSTFKLATTLANAQASNGIILTSSQTKTTTDTFTLAPLGFTPQNCGIQLQWSDDNVTYFSGTTGNYGAAISSVTFVAAGTTTLYDLGPIQHRYLRFNETPPSTGAINYTITDNERYSFKH